MLQEGNNHFLARTGCFLSLVSDNLLQSQKITSVPDLTPLKSINDYLIISYSTLGLCPSYFQQCIWTQIRKKKSLEIQSTSAQLEVHAQRK